MRVSRDVGAVFARIASFSARRATLVIAAAVLLSLAGLGLALTMDSGRAVSAAGDGGGETAAATDDLRREFGEDPIVILVRGRLTGMLLTEDVARMLSLEGCISGNVPRGAEPAAPVCSRFARERPVQVVYGPGTFINEAANQVLDRINFDRRGEALEAGRAAREARRVARRRGLSEAEQEQFAQEARRVVTARYAQRALELAVRFGLNSVPALNNPEFVLQLVFEPSLGAEFPKPRFAYLFPHSDAAVIQARLRPGLSDDEQARAVEMVREAVDARPFDLKFGTYVVSGSPVVAEGVAAGLSDAAPALAVAALLLVALALVLAFRHRPVLLPLALGAGATAITLGGAALVGAAFSAGVAAAMPVVCGLAAGWALELQARSDAPRAGPEVALAALVSAAAFAVLLLSPVEMARELGAVLAVGVVVAVVLAFTVGAAVAAGRVDRGRGAAPIGRRLRAIGARVPAGKAPQAPRRRTRVAAGVRARVRPALDALAGLPAAVGRAGRAALAGAVRRPGRAVGIAVAVALVGVLAGTQLDVSSDPGRLLPADQLEARDLASIERETGTPGDVNLIVRSERLLDPEVVEWMSSYQRRVLRQNGFRPGRPCREADLCPALSLTNLFGAGRQSARSISEAVDALPPYFSQNVITRDRQTANIAFRMGAMPAEERRAVVSKLRAELDPPAGVDADLAGPVIAAADGEDDITTAMWLLPLVALAIVAAVAAAGARSGRAIPVVAIPLAVAAGWAFLILFVLPIEADFLTSSLAGIVVAVWAGPVLLAARRYRAERAGGLAPEAAVAQTRAAGARDVLAFGAVVTAGFLALTVCDVPALRDLGAAATVAVPVCGLGLAVALPATLVWADGTGAVRIPRSRAELAAAGRSLTASLRGAAGVVRRGVGALGRAVPKAGRKMRAAVTFRR